MQCWLVRAAAVLGLSAMLSACSGKTSLPVVPQVTMQSSSHFNSEYSFKGFLFTCDGGTIAGIYTGSDHITVVGTGEFPNYIDNVTAKFISLNGAWTEHFHDMLNVTQVAQQHIVDANHTTVFYLGHLQQRYEAVIHVQRSANGTITTERVETRCYGP